MSMQPDNLNEIASFMVSPILNRKMTNQIFNRNTKPIKPYFEEEMKIKIDDKFEIRTPDKLTVERANAEIKHSR